MVFLGLPPHKELPSYVAFWGPPEDLHLLPPPPNRFISSLPWVWLGLLTLQSVAIPSLKTRTTSDRVCDNLTVARRVAIISMSANVNTVWISSKMERTRPEWRTFPFFFPRAPCLSSHSTRKPASTNSRRRSDRWWLKGRVYSMHSFGTPEAASFFENQTVYKCSGWPDTSLTSGVHMHDPLHSSNSWPMHWHGRREKNGLRKAGTSQHDIKYLHGHNVRWVCHARTLSAEPEGISASALTTPMRKKSGSGPAKEATWQIICFNFFSSCAFSPRPAPGASPGLFSSSRSGPDYDQGRNTWHAGLHFREVTFQSPCTSLHCAT